MSVAANLARARELDDPYPDATCPGCGQDLTGWELYECHYGPGAVIRLAGGAIRTRTATDPWPFNVGRNGTSSVTRPCVWTTDYLLARAFRRRYIAEHSERAA